MITAVRAPTRKISKKTKLPRKLRPYEDLIKEINRIRRILVRNRAEETSGDVIIFLSCRYLYIQGEHRKALKNERDQLRQIAARNNIEL